MGKRETVPTRNHRFNMSVHLQLLKPNGSNPPLYTAMDAIATEIKKPDKGTFQSDGSFVPTGTVSYKISIPDPSIRRGWFFRVRGDPNRQYRIEGVEYIEPMNLAVILRGVENSDILKIAVDLTIGGDTITVGGKKVTV